ncbi:MAG: CarD family transcriptional regulator [Clostridia bacterium]|nr:CarD family transcriptional regulator [Clostridia bacterium]
MEYNIGDKIVYPMHGAGIIEAIEDREIMGEMHRYYIMRMPIGDMKVMIPVDNAKEIGIRDVIDKEEADKVIESFKSCSTESDSNWNRRYRENIERIKSGNIYEVVRVVKNLMFREKSRGLSTGDRKMLNGAKQILVSELVIAKSVKQSEVENIMNEIVSAELT